MNMKRFGVIVLAAVVACSVIGCGGSKDNDNDDVDITASSFAGTWRMTFRYADGDTEVWIATLTQNGVVVTGTIYEEGYADDEPSTITGTVSGSGMTVREVDPYDGDVYLWTATLSGNTLSGSGEYQADGSATSTFTGTRQ